MATTTEIETGESSRSKIESGIKSFLRGVGVAGLVGVVMIHTQVMALLLTETVGEDLAGTPAEFAISTVLMIPVIASLLAFAQYVADLLTGDSREWSEVIIYATGAAWVLSPLVMWVAG